MADAAGRRRQRSSYYDADVLEWLEERGARLDRSVDWQVREILRAAMEAEREQPTESERVA
jgi:plasmid stability protein